MSLILALVAAATAAEVVWLTEPDAATQAAVAAAAGAEQPPLSLLDLRAAASGVSPADEESYKRLAQVLADVRAYETKLDGELLILRDLEAPLTAIEVVRDATDRQRVFDALAYQGFAANRFWGPDLANDDEAADWRVDLNGLVIERPWRDAAAMHPEAEITAYQIAEAPQRVAYASVQEAVTGALPASLAPAEMPAGAILVVDGQPRQPGPAGDVKVPPGRHWVHIEQDGRVLMRWTITPGPGEQVPLGATATEADWRAWAKGLTPGGEVPVPLATSVQALGGEVWVASGSGRDLTVVAVTADAVREQDVDLRVTSSGSEGGPSFWVTGGVGWLSSGNFYTDDPAVAPRTGATVNAVAPALALGLDWDVGWFRAGVGVDTALPVGAHHAQVTSGGAIRPRPQVQASVGVKPVQAVVGWLFPYHPAVGAQATWAFGPLELRGGYTAGLPGTVSRDGGPDWERLAVHRAGIGVGVRL